MKVISFNSYKGGACRTTTCYNALPYLAIKLGATSDRPILVFDIDLDSMGLTNIFNAEKSRTEVKKMQYSAKHLFVDDANNINNKLRRERLRNVKDDDWYFSNFEKVGVSLGLDDNGSVLFCGADKDAPSISDDDYVRYKDSQPMRELMRKLKTMEQGKQPVAVIFDCAAGVQMSTIAALGVTDCAVMCMRPTMQFRVGTHDYLLTQIPNELNNNLRRKKRKIILLPTAVAQVNVPENDPNRENAETELARLKKRTFDKIREEIIADVENDDSELGYDLNTDMTEGCDVVGIPEIERFKWEEALLYKLEPWTEQEKILKKQYSRLADIIAEESNDNG